MAVADGRRRVRGSIVVRCSGRAPRTHSLPVLRASVRMRGGPAEAPRSGRPRSRSTAARSASRAGPRPRPLDHPERLPTPLVRDAARRARAGLVGRGARPRSRRAFARSRSATAATRSASSAAARSRTRRRTCSASSRASRCARGNIDYNGRFCMSSRRRPRNQGVRHRPRAAVPARGHRRAPRSILLVGSNLAETMPPVMQYFEAQRARGGALIVVDPRRTPTAQAATCTCGSRRAPTPRSPTACCTSSCATGWSTRTTSRERTEGFARRARRASPPTGRSASSASRACPRPTRARRAPARRGATADGAHGARRRAAGAGRRQRRWRSSISRSRSGRSASRAAATACLTGQGNGQGGREHGQKADQLPGISAHRRPGGARARRGGLGHPGARAFRARACRRTSCSTRSVATAGVRALLVCRLQPGRLGAARAAHRASGCARSTCSSSRLLPLGDRGAGRRGAAGRAVGRGRGHDDEPRGSRHPAPARAARRRRRACAPTSRSSARLARTPRARRALRLRQCRATSSTSCAARARAASPTTRGSPTSGSRRSRASSGLARHETTRARRGCSPRRFPTPSGRARFHRACGISRRRRSPTRVSALPHDRPRARAVPVRHADAPRRAS